LPHLPNRTGAKRVVAVVVVVDWRAADTAADVGDVGDVAAVVEDVAAVMDLVVDDDIAVVDYVAAVIELVVVDEVVAVVDRVLFVRNSGVASGICVQTSAARLA